MPNRFTQDGPKVAAEVREAQKAFIARGLASLAASRESGEYFFIGRGVKRIRRDARKGKDESTEVSRIDFKHFLWSN